MNKKRLFKLGAFLAIGLLALGAMGFRTLSAHAQSSNSPAAQSQDCAADQANDATEVKSAGADTDAVDLQCGDQSGPDTLNAGLEAAQGVEAAAGVEAAGPDTDNVQSGEQSGNQVEDGQPDLPGAAPEAPGK